MTPSVDEAVFQEKKAEVLRTSKEFSVAHLIVQYIFWLVEVYK